MTARAGMAQWSEYEQTREVSDMTAGRPTGGHLKSGKKRTLSSRRWLERQLNDPYVAEAKRRGLRSRAAFKLMELDDRFALLRPGARVVDLGAAPGGWTQISAERVRAGKPGGGTVVGIDVLDMAPIFGAVLIRADILDPESPKRLMAALGGQADVVLSDLAPPASGHAGADHLRIVGLVEEAVSFAYAVLAPAGMFVAKVWQGGTEAHLLAEMKRRFRSVRHAKPPASRPESAEVYVVAMGFRGAPSDETFIAEDL
ncbi:MAG: RlmE family RNA methyltransferase [Rhodospirillales bacterium]|nr:RlmE family RNA methyltransferase [Rhodospirillales bacterium]